MTVVAAARATVPSTCGELVQGIDSRGPLLVSLPIEVSGTVEVALTRSHEVEVTPRRPRAETALHLALDRSGWRGGARVRLGCEVPVGRGMASSTVDVAGVIGAVFAAAGRALSAQTLLTLMTAVEPSDSSPFAGLWAVDHVAATRSFPLRSMPHDWRLVAVDSGAALDTLAAHRAYGAGPRIPDGVADSLRHAGSRELARLATESAVRNQERLPHPAFSTVRAVATATGALGVCVAHSGSLCAAICQGAASAGLTAAALRSHGLACTGVWRVAAPGMRVEVRAAAPAAAGR